MSKPSDGGPAFPTNTHEFETVGREQYVLSYDGMTLRDYFAAAALQGLTKNPNNHWGSRAEAAEDFYKLADAMLAEREKEAK